PVDRSVMLALDASESMADDIDEAKAAAETFLDTVPADVKVGLVTFAKDATLAVEPITDRDKVRERVRQIDTSVGTALYDGIQLALDELGDNGVRSIVLLSDGDDTTSTADLPSTVDNLRASGVDLDAVAFADGDIEVLGELTTAGTGRLVQTADSTDLESLFEESAEAIARQVLITAPLPATIQAGDFDVAVEATAGTALLSDSAHGLLTEAALPPIPRSGPTPVNPSARFFDSDPALLAGGMLLFAGLAVIAGFGFAAFAGNRRGADMRRRLAQYSMANPMAPGAIRSAESGAEDGGGNGSGSRLGDSAIARSAVDLAERVVVSRDVEGKLAARLEAAAVPLRPAEWVLLHAASAIVPSFLLLLISGGDLPLSLLGLIAGAVTPHLYLSSKKSSRRQKFEDQLPTTLQLLAGSLAAGYSLPQAVDTVAREAAEPVSTEFGRAIMESRLGVPVEDALEHVAQRTSSEDFSWVVMAVRIQREVGGNLAELLTTIAATLRERERLRRQVRVLSAEGRLSAYILTGLPILFALYLFVVRREYLMKLFTDPLGIGLLFGGVGALLIGVFWMRRIVNVEV
ncbi:MAG TPA: type II secretion system F family protein, partial [Actinomycetes bacterium]|nr:type II secretion system F family protein [Actinomycetes bacterium]